MSRIRRPSARTTMSPLSEPESMSEIRWSETTASVDGDVVAPGMPDIKHIPSKLDFDPTLVTIKSESGERWWREHHSVFTEQSPHWKHLLAYEDKDVSEDPYPYLKGIVRAPEGGRWTFRLQGVLDEEFDALMEGLKPKLGRKLPLSHLRPMLVLATRWGFTDVREYAIQEIPSHHMDPIERVRLARETDVVSWKWLGPPYIALSVRLAPLEPGDIDVLGARASSAVNKARQAVLLRRTRLVSRDVGPTWMGGSWWHKNCWKTLYEAWRQTLASREDKEADSPHELLMRALKKRDFEVDGRPPKPLCPSCDSKHMIFGWLAPWTDNEIAESALLEALPEHNE